MKPLLYRFATAQDLPLLTRLNVQLVADGADFGPADPSFLQRRLRRWLADGSNHAVLFENGHGKVLAYALYKEYAGEIYLRQFLVLRAARCQGVGRQAFELLRRRIWPADKRLTLEVLSANRSGYRFWRSLGYRDCAMTLEIPAPKMGQASHKATCGAAVTVPAPLPAPGFAARMGQALVGFGLRLRTQAIHTAHAAGRRVAALTLICLVSPPVAAAPAAVLTPPAELSIPAQLPAGSAPSTLGDPELRALRASGGRCPASVYRTAWAVAAHYGLEPAWVIAMIEAESSCRADAVSKSGALGLMQLVPASGARDAYRLVYGKDVLPTAALLRDPEANIRLGVAYLRALHDHFARVGSAQARLLLAVAAYNCGTDLFDSGLPLASAGWDSGDITAWIGQHAPHETRGYVSQVLARGGAVPLGHRRHPRRRRCGVPLNIMLRASVLLRPLPNGLAQPAGSDACRRRYPVFMDNQLGEQERQVLRFLGLGQDAFTGCCACGDFGLRLRILASLRRAGLIGADNRLTDAGRRVLPV